MGTYTLELSDGRREYIAAANLSQARFRADSVAEKVDKSITYKLRESTEEEKTILLRAHSWDFAGDLID